MKLSQPFIRLPFRFDVARLNTELAQFESSAWMPHPSGVVGNSAIPLISQGGEMNNYFVGNMQPTEALGQCHYFQQVMAEFDEVLARSRLMRLDAGAEVTAHVDFNYHWYSRVRVHIPIITNPDVVFYCGDQSLHMQAGECWIFDSWRWHNVVNRGSEDRVHLVIDLAGSARFWRLVEQMSQFDPQQPINEIPIQFNNVAYRPDATNALIKTEAYNAAPIMAPGELSALAEELIGDFSAQPDNPPELVTYYQSLLRNLAYDWRSLWAQYGYSELGWSAYRTRLEETMQQLKPDPRALITNSNKVGVNPIIIQRILRAALNPDQVSRFSGNGDQPE